MDDVTWCQNLIAHSIATFVLSLFCVVSIHEYFSFSLVKFIIFFIVTTIVTVIAGSIFSWDGYIIGELMLELEMKKEEEVQKVQRLCDQIGLDVVVGKDYLPVYEDEYSCDIDKYLYEIDECLCEVDEHLHEIDKCLCETGEEIDCEG